MIPARQVIALALLLWLAAVLQGRLAHAIQIRGAQPDLLLVVLACGASLVGGTRGTVLGLWAGLLWAAMQPGDFGSLLVSRTLAGAFAGALQSRVIRDSLIVPPLAALATTLVCEGVFALMAPAFAVHQPRLWLRVVGGGLLYNALLAFPVYLLLRRLGIGEPVEDPFALRS